MPLEQQRTYFKLSLPPEQYFHQDSARGNAAEALGTVYNFPKSFGLKSNDWAGLKDILRKKNQEQPGKVEHVLIFLARHGQGYHNIGEEYLGTQVWKDPSALSPDRPMHEHFPDARLTPVGQHQADTLSETLKALLQDEVDPGTNPSLIGNEIASSKANGIPWPQAFYVSPLHRAMETSHRTWSPLSSTNRPYNPIVQESLRERIYIQHCNQRSTQSKIKKFTFKSKGEINQPGNQNRSSDEIFTIKPSSLGVLTEQDSLFERHVQNSSNETEQETMLRAYNALSHILIENWERGIQYISITSHGGFMAAIYQIFGLQHGDVPRFPTGIVVPLLIRAERVNEPVRLVDVQVSDLHWDWGVPGVDLHGKSTDEVLSEIRDLDVYQRMIRLFENMRQEGLVEDQFWKDQIKSELSLLERIIVRAFV